MGQGKRLSFATGLLFLMFSVGGRAEPLATANENPPPSASTPAETVAPPAPPAPVPVPAVTLQPISLQVNPSALKFDGVVFFKYRYEMQATSSIKRDDNAFDFDRAYLSVTAPLWEKAIFKYTLEGGDVRDLDTTGTSTQLDTASKQLYLEQQDLLEPGVVGRMGLQPVPIIDQQTKFWGHRFLNKVALERWSYMSSSDLGVGLAYVQPRIEVYTAVLNGEGWKSAERRKYKDINIYSQWYPLASKKWLVAGGAIFGRNDAVSTNEGPDYRRRFSVQTGYKEDKRFTAAVSFDYLIDSPTNNSSHTEDKVGNLYSGYVIVNSALMGLWEQLELIARVDYLNPDINKSSMDMLFKNGAISYIWNPKFTTALAFENIQYGPNATANSGSTAFDESRMLVQTQITF